MTGFVALVLHAHLPYVRHPEHARSLEERWLYEALWECYLPLLAMLDRLAKDGERAPLTISISPTLAAMFGDDLLRRRFEDHLARLERLATSARAIVLPELGVVLDFYRVRLGEARAAWDRIGGDVLSAFAAHARAERVELITTAATHAFLPGLITSPRSALAQVRLGLAGFEALSGVRPTAFWLPECAFDPSLEPLLAKAGVRATVIDAHGLELARPRPRQGSLVPTLSPNGIAFFARDPDASEAVWSRRTGYPGDALYRDFYRDAGFDLPAEALEDELGPNGERLMTGLKLHRVTGASNEKLPYDPRAAEDRAREHARDFVDRRVAQLSMAEATHAPPVIVAPFDAELFGHWWFEGPVFLEQVLRDLADSARRGGPSAIGLGGYLARAPELEVVEPAASTWGEGGFSEAWTGPEAAHLLRHVHHAERAALRALDRSRHATGVRGRALDQALVEVLLLESSDFAFMLRRGEMVAYAETRARAHAGRAVRLARVAASDAPSDDDVQFLLAVEQRDPFLVTLRGERLRCAFEG